MGKLTDLAKTILAQAEAIDFALEKSNFPALSFEPDAPLGLPWTPEILGAKIQLLTALEDLNALAQGPSDLYGPGALAVNHGPNILNILNSFNFWDAVPLNGCASFANIAAKTSLPEFTVKRLLRYAFTVNLFAPTSPGSNEVKHTLFSAFYVREPGARAWTGHNLEEIWPAAAASAAGLKKHGGKLIEPNACGLSDTLASGKPFFQWINEPSQQWRVERFGQAMQWMSKSPAMDLNTIFGLYDWEKLGKAKLVDVGGSVGHISYMLLKMASGLTAIVQDLPELEPAFAKSVPEELKDRVSFEAHDFFQPQTRKDVDVWFMKHILHDWSDPYAVKILKGIVPVMKPGSRILICEGIVPPPGTAPKVVERIVLGLDMQMLTACNGRERTPEEWPEIFRQVDERLVLNNVYARPGLGFGIIEAILKE